MVKQANRQSLYFTTVSVAMLGVPGAWRAAFIHAKMPFPVNDQINTNSQLQNPCRQTCDSLVVHIYKKQTIAL